MTTTLAFVDTETTGLDDRIHQPYEAAIWREDEAEPVVLDLPHTLEYADMQALAIGRYFERGCAPFAADRDQQIQRRLIKLLHGATTLVGTNPGFDAGMLRRFTGTAVWHYRLINVSEGAMWLFRWDRPKGLADVVAALQAEGYEIPDPDHTAEGDVRATRAVYNALRDFRSRL